MMTNNSVLECCIIPSSQRIHTEEEALRETWRRYRHEQTKKEQGCLFTLCDATPNHPLLATRTFFEKSELLIPIDDKGRRVPIALPPALAAAHTFDQTIMVGNKTKKKLIDLLNECAEGTTLPQVAFTPDLPDYSSRLFSLLNSFDPHKKNGSFGENVRRGYAALPAAPKRFFLLTSDLPNISHDELQRLQATVQRDWRPDHMAYVFANTRYNSEALDFPRSFNKVLKVAIEGEPDAPASNLKEGNAYALASRMITDKGYFSLLQTCYGARKLFTSEGLQRLLHASPRIPSVLWSLHQGAFHLAGHTAHNLVWDIDSVEDLVLQTYRRWNKRDHPDYPVLRAVADKVADPSTTVGRLYANYDDRLAEYLDSLGIPSTLTIGLTHGSLANYRREVLYDPRAFRRLCVT